MNQPNPDATGSGQATAPGKDAATLLAQALGESVETSVDAHGTPCARVPREQWTAAALFARDDLGLDFFDWLSAVDELDADEPGIDIVVHVADSHDSHAGASSPDERVVVRRMLLMTRAPQDDLTVPSLTPVWAGAAWHERETFEMFGVDFTGYQEKTGLALRPLLLPDGFEGNPLRKSFVLASRAVRPWPGAGEPGESGASSRRAKVQAPGVPDPATWGPREAVAPDAVAADAPVRTPGEGNDD